MDISASMLDVALERECEGDLLLGDLGSGLPLRPHAFDGAVSISAVQWLCNADTAGADPRARGCGASSARCTGRCAGGRAPCCSSTPPGRSRRR